MPLGLSLATVGRRGLGGGDGARARTSCSACRGSSRCCSARSRSPTDAAAVFSVLRVVPLPRRITGPLEAESGLNDAPTVVLVTLISTGAVAGQRRARDRRASSSSSWSPACSSGSPCGFGGAWVMRRAALPSSGLYPLAVLTPDLPRRTAARPRLHASGFAAVYVAALVLGNTELPHRGGHPVLRRGGGLAGPDRAVRDARAAALAGPDRPSRSSALALVAGPGAHLRGPAAVGAGQRGGAADAAGASWRSSRGPGCAARCRSCSPPSRSPRAWTAPSGSSTSSS